MRFIKMASLKNGGRIIASRINADNQHLVHDYYTVVDPDSIEDINYYECEICGCEIEHPGMCPVCRVITK